MSLITFRNVSHDYGGHRALDSVSFVIADKKITVILGKSGSGKSTILQVINGLIIPSSGEVNVFGEPLNYKQIVRTRLKIGYSVQGTGLFPHMTVYNNIALLGRITKQLKHDTERRVDFLMSLVNLPPSFKTKYPYQLSGGEQQRVGICRAMLLNPPIFLLDEAFGALDNETRTEIHTELLNMQKLEPRTIVLVTHDIAEALKLADDLMMVEAGIIKHFGTKEEVLKVPENEFMKQFSAEAAG
jgi:osmoprotectant transport system ATP-binding protein